MATTPKKDFAGKNKTKDTYDKDWQFVKIRAKGPNQSHGAWMTNRKARELKEQQKQDRAFRLAQAGTAPVPGVATPTPTPTPISGVADIPASGNVPVPGSDIWRNGGGGGGQERVENVTTPSWWISKTYTNPTEEQAFANAANAILPTLSPEDAKSMGLYLATNFPDVYGGYANTTFGPIPSEMNSTIRKSFTSQERAGQALSLLERMRSASGKSDADMGKGYQFLKNSINLLTQFNTGKGPMTREQYAAFQTAVSNLAGQAGKDISAYGNLAQMFNLPGFTAGPIVSNAANKLLNV
jgi:hypothetical protein